MKNFLQQLHFRSIGLVPARHQFPNNCQRRLCLSKLFKRRGEGSTNGDPEKASVIIGFLHSPVEYPLMAALWYTPITWMTSCVSFVLFDFLYMRRAVLAIPLGRGIHSQCMPITILHWPTSGTSQFVLIRLQSVENDDETGNCVISLPNMNCSDCQERKSRFFHFHKYCIKFPKNILKNGLSRLYPWSPSISMAKFYDVVLATTDVVDQCVEIASLFHSSASDFVDIYGAALEEKSSSDSATMSARSKCTSFAQLSTSTVVYLRRSDHTQLQMPKSCFHTRELKSPSIVTETEELQPVCADCLYALFLSKPDVYVDECNLQLLLIRQARLYFSSACTHCKNFGISVNGDCMLIAGLCFPSEVSSPSTNRPACLDCHSLIFNLQTFCMDCVVSSKKGLSICLPVDDDSQQCHMMSNEPFLNGKSLQYLYDYSKRFVIINDTVSEEGDDASDDNS